MSNHGVTMKNKEIKKIQQSGWTKRAFKDIRSKVNLFDDEGEKKQPRTLKKKKKVKCRSKAHVYIEIHKQLGVRGLDWIIYKCEKCGYIRFRL